MNAEGSIRRFGEREPGIVYTPRPAAYAVIFDGEGRVACVDEHSGLFLPGGGLEPGEDALAGVHREVAEECARALEIVSTLAPAVQLFRTRAGQAFELHASFFLGRLGAKLDRQPEHTLRWMPVGPDTPFHHACHRWAVEGAR